jgi:hypothetical protein
MIIGTFRHTRQIVCKYVGIIWSFPFSEMPEMTPDNPEKEPKKLNGYGPHV